MTAAGHSVAFRIAGRSAHWGAGGGLDLACWPIGVLALAGLLTLVLSGEALRTTAVVSRLTAAQAALFVLQELLERGGSRGGIVALTGSPGIRYGICGQVIVALVAVVLVRLLAVGAARLRAGLPGRRRQLGDTPAMWSTATSRRITGWAVVGLPTGRGPPSTVAPI